MINKPTEHIAISNKCKYIKCPFLSHKHLWYSPMLTSWSLTIFSLEKADCNTSFLIVSAKFFIKLCSSVQQQQLSQLKPARPGKWHEQDAAKHAQLRNAHYILFCMICCHLKDNKQQLQIANNMSFKVCCCSTSRKINASSTGAKNPKKWAPFQVCLNSFPFSMVAPLYTPSGIPSQQAWQLDTLTACTEWQLICTNFKPYKSTCHNNNIKELGPSR